MTLISPEYQAMQREMHASKTYGDSGKKWATQVQQIADKYLCRSVLDYGCGTNAMAFNFIENGWRGSIWSYDPGRTEPTYSDPPPPADLVACLDVLEHIEPEHLDEVLEHLRSLALKVLFVVISTRRAGKVLPDGRNAHLIVRPWPWWRGRLLLQFALDEAWEQAPSEWCAVLRPR